MRRVVRSSPGEQRRVVRSSPGQQRRVPLRRVPVVLTVCLALVLSACTAQRAAFEPTTPSTTNGGGGGGATPSPTTEPEPTTVQPVAGFNPKQHEHWELPPGVSPNREPLKSSAMPPGMSAAPAGTTMQTYLDQKITWKACEEFQCGSVQVPLDWDKPAGPRITIKMTKVEATSATKLGSLFINPGGPGGSGQEYAKGYDANRFPGYDVIGWDPRGSGESTPAVCWDDGAQDKFNLIDGSPDNVPEWVAFGVANRDFAESCRKKSGALLDHISTIDNVRDLDYLRYLVGDKKLTYNGVSYGTYIGATYAELYPDRVGRMVLDSAVNITDKASVVQAQGFDLALNAFAEWCVKQGCELGKTPQEVVKSITDYWDKLDSEPAKVGDRLLTQTMAVGAVAMFMYWGTQGYEQLYALLKGAIIDNKPAGLLIASDRWNGRDDKGHYDPITYSFPSIICADNVDGGMQYVPAGWEYVKEKAPVFGTYFGPGGTCQVWTAQASEQLKLTAKGAAPILVLGATGDPATPYQQSVWMAEQLESGTLLTWKGAGHGVYSLGNKCATTAVERYINEGVVPPDQTVC